MKVKIFDEEDEKDLEVDINDFLFNYSKKLKNIVKPYHLCRNKNY